MKQITNFIKESKTIDEIVIKDQNNKKVDAVYFCYDKESLNKVTDQYEKVGKYWIDKGFFLAKLKNKSTWKIDTNKEFEVHTWRPNADFIERDEGKEKYTYKELVELLEKGDTMLIVINK